MADQCLWRFPRVPMWVGFTIMDGFDLGVAVLHPFVAWTGRGKSAESPNLPTGDLGSAAYGSLLWLDLNKTEP